MREGKGEFMPLHMSDGMRERVAQAAETMLQKGEDMAPVQTESRGTTWYISTEERLLEYPILQLEVKEKRIFVGMKKPT